MTNKQKLKMQSGGGFGAIARSTSVSMDHRLVQGVVKKKIGVSGEEQFLQSNDNDKVPANRITSNAVDPDEEEEEPDDSDGEVMMEITQAELDACVKSQVDQISRDRDRIKQQLEEELERIKAAAAAKEAALEAEVKKSHSMRAALVKRGVTPSRDTEVSDRREKETTSRQQAYITPQVNFGADDILKEAMRIWDSTTKHALLTDVGQVMQSSDQELFALLRKDKQVFRQAMEKHAKESGLLVGLAGSQITQAGTTTGDLTPFLLKGLSLFMRTTMVGKHNWQQFVTTKVALGKNRGETVEVPRYAYMNTSRDPNDYDLGRDDDLSSVKQPISIGSEPITLGLKGLGKTGLAGTLNAPVSVARFFEATSLEDLMGILQKMLLESYRQFQTAAISTEYDKSTQRYYNNGGQGTTAIASLATGAGGQLTQDFLDYMGAVMSEDVPAYDNGKYVLQCGAFELLQLRRSLQARNLQLSKMATEELSAVLHPNTPSGDLMPVSGYVGDLGQFMIFETGTIYKMLNALSTPTIAGAARQVYNAFAFGADAVGHAQAMPFSLIYDHNTNFSLRNTVSWASIEQYKAIDVDPTLTAVGQVVRQQQRVYKLACSRTPI